ncbi:MAG: DHH family phosphoesterase [archaeon]|nr:MAG: DHH family phosphoesterase [archaeon]
MKIKEAVSRFKEVLEREGMIKVVTHIDTDGLTSAAVLIKALKKLDQQFCVVCLKQLEDHNIDQLYEEVETKKWKAIFFLDLGSTKLAKLSKFSEHIKTIILDHHELQEKFIVGRAIEDVQSENFIFVNPVSEGKEENVNASTVVYQFVKELDKKNEELAQLAVLGMVGDVMNKSISKINNSVIADAKKHGMQAKRGLDIFSTTRALNKALEFGSSIFIPGVTGSSQGALAFLRELDISIRDKNRGGFRTLLDLNKEEISRLITGIMLRRRNKDDKDIIGTIYLLKLYGRLYDAREASAMMNACGRLGHASIALSFLLNSGTAKEKVEMVYNKYKHHLVSGLNFVNSTKKIESEGFMIVNAQDNIKDTIIGTVISILASSSVNPDGTILVGMAYRGDKIKVSSRIAGRNINNVNLHKLLDSVVKQIGDGEAGGHVNAAGALISKNKEQTFITSLQKALQIEEIKIKI